MHLETTREPMTFFITSLPKYITLALYLEPKDVNSSTTSSINLESQFKGTGPIILFLGRQPIAISGSKE